LSADYSESLNDSPCERSRGGAQALERCPGEFRVFPGGQPLLVGLADEKLARIAK